VIRRSLLADGQLIRDSIAPAETRGLPGAPNGAAQPLDSIFTLIDGPRSDVEDQTRFWTNAYGAPTRIRNALGRETRIWYSGAWPGLAERTQAPNRLVSRAWYNARALPDSTRIDDPVGTGEHALTRYWWHAEWAAPTQVQSPVGVVSTFDYDAATGNRRWQQIGPDPATRVHFDYYPNRLLAAVRAPQIGPDSIYYSLLGNVRRTRSPTGYNQILLSDAIGRDTLVFSPVDAILRDSAAVRNGGARTHTTFDLADRLRVVKSWGPGVSTGPSPSGHQLPADSILLVHHYDAEGNLRNTTRHYTKHGQPYTLQTTWEYDTANRLRAHAPQGTGSESYVLDPAGNVVQIITRKAAAIEQEYDALGQLTRRVVPQVDYSSASCRNHPDGCLGWSFPTLGALPNGGLCIAADTANFTYDVSGRVRRADNGYARVRRDYTPGGLLTTEELRIRTYYRSATLNPCGEEAPEPMVPAPTLEWDFAQHVYVTSRTYDVAGRRRTLTHPDGGGTQHYDYDPATGLISEVVDVLGNAVSFHYDDALRLQATLHPGNVVTEVLEVDGEGGVRVRSGPAGVETTERDGLGRVVSGTVADWREVRLWYHGLGPLAAAHGLNGTSVEAMDFDALGNRYSHWISGPAVDHGVRRHSMSYTSAARLDSVWVAPGDPVPFPLYNYRHRYDYDASGNVFRTWGFEHRQGSGGGGDPVSGAPNVMSVERFDDETISYYGADDRLRIFNRQIGHGTSFAGGVFEEYRYDALGRRVLVRSRATSPCEDPQCNSYIERTAWDGDQVVLEIRAPGRDGVAPQQLNSDLAWGSAVDNYLLGRVRYMHGMGIDQPLTIIRERMDAVRYPNPIAVAPHANWQGDYAAGTLMDGTSTEQCDGSNPGCPPISWVGNWKLADGLVFRPAQSWFGSIVAQKADGSGLHYKRNRYYDPATGRFTQEDPIGLAGGLNLYGYANGDPVNFHDPFGLSGCDRQTNRAQGQSEEECNAMLRQQRENMRQLRRCYVAGGLAVASGAGDATFATGAGAVLKGIVLAWGGGRVARSLARDAITRDLAPAAVMESQAFVNQAGQAAARTATEHGAAAAAVNTGSAASGSGMSWRDWVPFMATGRAFDTANEVCGGEAS
jgi:RHS repeat-associated protein